MHFIDRPTMVHHITYLNDRCSDVFLLHHHWIVGGAVGETRSIVVDVLDLDDDETLAAAARRSAAAAPIVSGRDVQSVGHSRLV